MNNSTNTDEYYSAEKWKDICEVTLSNYANMKKRLNRRDSTSKFILIYYSIVLIVYTLTNKYFPDNYNSILGEYFSIILSIVLLAYSLINNNARYSERIRSLEESINGIKTIKRSLSTENLDQQKEKYNTIVDRTEMRKDVDFFNTVKSICKRNNIRWYLKIKKFNLIQMIVNKLN